MLQAHKRPPQKKRHTKPCKYFQSMKCPLSAEACDFAHVMAVPVFFQNPVLCRYYMNGHCTNGALCRFKHGNEDRAGSSFHSPQEFSADQVYNEISPSYNYYSSYYPGWTGYSDAGAPVPPYPPRSHFSISPDPTDSTSTGTSASLNNFENDEIAGDEAALVTEDPQFVEHTHEHQSRIHVCDSSPVVHIPPLYFPENAPGSRNRSRSAVRHKVQKYKTKPCKYYRTDRGCPKGKNCTFVHEEPPLPGEHQEQQSKSTSRSSSKPSSSQQKNFFPISWRVIGGGVRLASAKEDHEEPRRSRSCSISSTQNSDADHPEENIDSGTSDLYVISTSTDIQKSEGCAPVKRVRSNSIPPTPTSTYFRPDLLFSAESPGVL